jgi:hypothetical protein
MTTATTPDTNMDIQQFLIQIATDIAEVKTATLAMHEDLAEVKEYQKAQNGRVFQLADRFNAMEKIVAEHRVSCPLGVPEQIAAMRIELAKQDEHTKTNQTWFAVGWSFFGSLVAVVGRMLVDLMLGK